MINSTNLKMMKHSTTLVTLLAIAMLCLFRPNAFSQATQAQQFVNPIPIPYLVTDKDQFLTFHGSTHNFAPNTTIPGMSDSIINAEVATWAINEDGKTTGRMSYLGPTLVWEIDDVIGMWTTNDLPPSPSPGNGDSTTAHWHGLNIKASADGGPHQPFTTGNQLVTSFPIRDSVQTLWYHSHVMEYTTEQVIMGLAGMVIIQDPQNDPYYAQLPHDYSKNDFPIVIQEKVFKFDTTTSPNVATEMIVRDNPGNGEYTIINGIAYGTLRVPKEMVRLRMLNGSPRKSFNVGLSPSLVVDTFLTPAEMDTLWQIATDGSYTSEPHPQTTFLISPGERGEFIVDFGKYEYGDTVYLSNHISSIRDGVMKGTGRTTSQTPTNTIAGTPGYAFMAFIVSDTVIANDPIFTRPATLQPYVLQDTSDIARHRTKKLQFSNNPPPGPRTNGPLMVLRWI
jgi:FtsP/CotA-like multicopper oxidase with cupredoxin domain